MARMLSSWLAYTADMQWLFRTLKERAQREGLDVIELDVLWEELLRPLLIRGSMAAALNWESQIEAKGPLVHGLTTEIPKSIEGPIADLHLSDEVEKVLTLALDWSEKCGCNYVAGEHVLLAMLEDTESPFSRELRERGIRLEDARFRIMDVWGFQADA